MWRIKLWVLVPVAMIGFLIRKVRRLGRTPANKEMPALEEVAATRALVDELVRDRDIEPKTPRDWSANCSDYATNIGRPSKAGGALMSAMGRKQTVASSHLNPNDHRRSERPTNLPTVRSNRCHIAPSFNPTVGQNCPRSAARLMSACDPKRTIEIIRAGRTKLGLRTLSPETLASIIGLVEQSG
jgi:hypothetical protein